MVGSRTLTALAGVAVSLVVSALLWYYFGSLVFFLFVPFVPFLFRGFGGRSGAGAEREPTAKECPVCGFRTTDERYDYCPRDGNRLR